MASVILPTLAPAKADAPAPSPDRDVVAAACKALCDDTRLRIVELLADGERCVCDIQGPMGISQPLLSFHLKVLREAGVVSDRRAGRWAYYSLRPDTLAALSAALDALRVRAVSCTAGDTQCCA